MHRILPVVALVGALVGLQARPGPAQSVAGAEAVAADFPRLPRQVPAADWRPLYDAVDEELQRQLRARLVGEPGLRTLLRQKKLAVGVVDLREASHPRFARLNGNHMMYAASLPKIAILLAAYEAFEDGSMEESPEVRAKLTEMIRVSSNSAATEMIDRLGYERIAATLTDPRYELYDRERGGGLWVGKRFAKQGRRFPDPLTGLSHAATVTQVCRFYYLLATGRVISPQRSRQMLDDLGEPGLHHKFVKVVEARAPRARLYRKSGTWKVWHSDSILVWGPDWRRYILVAMVESPEGERILQALVPTVEELLLAAPTRGGAASRR